MKVFQIYKNNAGIFEAVKIGWNWPAFLVSGFRFGWIWCFVKKVNGPGLALLFFWIFGLITIGTVIEPLIWLIDFGIMIWLGMKGNELRSNTLKERGFKYKGNIASANAEAAISEFINQNKSSKTDHNVDAPAIEEDLSKTEVADFDEAEIGQESIYLEFLNGPLKGQKIMVFKNTSIGRSSENSIVINDKKVSGSHCLIKVKSDEFYIQDLNSTNGTFINGEKITTSKIAQDDELKISSIKIKVH